MRKLIICLIGLPIFLIADFLPLVKYRTFPSSPLPNIVIFINQLQLSPNDQPILDRMLKKSRVQRINENYKEITSELFDMGYQLMIATYMNKYEWIGPRYNHHHYFLRYPIRVHSNRLNTERNIIRDAFSSLDQFVIDTTHHRPLCLIVQLPSKTNYQLEKYRMTTTFEKRRDFSLIYLYHEIHRRRYMHPTDVLVMPSIQSQHNILIKHKLF